MCWLIVSYVCCRLVIPVAVMLVHRCLRLMLSDVLTPSCLHHFLLEFLGTTIFLSISLSAVLILPPAAGNLQQDLKIEGNQSNLGNLCNFSNHFQLTPLSVQHPSCLQVALAFGLSVALVLFCVGGEVTLNPVVTVAMALTLRLRLWRATLYVIGQMLGGVASTALLLGLTGDVTPALNKVSLCTTSVQQPIREQLDIWFACVCSRLLQVSSSILLSLWKHCQPSSWSWLSWQPSALTHLLWCLTCLLGCLSVWVTWWL